MDQEEKKVRFAAIKMLLRKQLYKSAKVAHRVAWLHEVRGVPLKRAIEKTILEKNAARHHYYKYLMHRGWFLRGLPVSEASPTLRKSMIAQAAM